MNGRGSLVFKSDLMWQENMLFFRTACRLETRHNHDRIVGGGGCRASLRIWSHEGGYNWMMGLRKFAKENSRMVGQQNLAEFST